MGSLEASGRLLALLPSECFAPLKVEDIPPSCRISVVTVVKDRIFAFTLETRRVGYSSLVTLPGLSTIRIFVVRSIQVFLSATDSRAGYFRIIVLRVPMI